MAKLVTCSICGGKLSSAVKDCGHCGQKNTVKLPLVEDIVPDPSKWTVDSSHYERVGDRISKSLLSRPEVDTDQVTDLWGDEAVVHRKHGRIRFDPSGLVLFYPSIMLGKKDLLTEEVYREIVDAPLVNASVALHLLRNQELLPKAWEATGLTFMGTLYRQRNVPVLVSQLIAVTIYFSHYDIGRWVLSPCTLRSPDPSCQHVTFDSDRPIVMFRK